MKKFADFKAMKKIISALCVGTVMLSFGAIGVNAAEVEKIGLNEKSVDVKAQLIDVNELKAGNGLPEKYSSVDMGYVTSVKSQNADNCWVFSTIASCESLFLKNGFKFNDLSVFHLDNFATFKPNGKGWQRNAGNGGYTEISMGYLISRQGPFSVLNDNTQVFAGYNVNSIEYIDKSNPVRIKELILENGAVTANYNANGSYLSNNMANFYCYNENAAISGHAVSVVGWDDNYPKANFDSCGKTPKSNGAWLIKNSWGEFGPLKGYNWISYEDVFLFSDVFSPSFALTSAEKASDYEKLYQNEIDGSTYAIDYFSGYDEVSYINFYDFSDGYDKLNKVIFNSKSVGADYKVYYIPAQYEKIESDKSKWSLLAKGTVDYKGYISVETNGFDLPLGYGAIGVTIDTQKVNKNLDMEDDRYVYNTFGTNEWLRDVNTGKYIFLNESREKESFVMLDDEIYDLKRLYKDVLEDELGATLVIKAEAENSSKAEPKATLIGDADLDNEITVKDATMIQLYVANLRKTSVIRDLNSDYDQDGETTVKDATYIQLFLAHLL